MEFLKRFRAKVEDSLTAFRVILFGFFALILTGGLLLWSPLAEKAGQSVPFIDALFTAASAACVTGLVIYDTATCWSMFGRIIIFILIQIGGLGVITIAVSIFMLTGRKIGLRQRTIMQDSVSAPQLGGIIRLTRFILEKTIIFELCGAALLIPVFMRKYDLVQSAGYALFHSVSAFCNAGFDLLGSEVPFSSLTAYSSDVWMNLVICSLIIIGGISFLTWDDIAQNHLHFRKYSLQTKIILTTTSVLIAVPAVYFFAFEFSGMEIKERILCSLFQSVTPRTAGFNTADISSLSEPGLLLTIILMMIGGAPSSTAGGLKVTTACIAVVSTIAYMKKRNHGSIFHRRIVDDIVSNALSLLMIYMTLLLAGTMAVSAIENVPVITAMFECASALGTVGLTTGITPQLHIVSKIILICFMYFGRVGGLTIAYSLVGKKKDPTRYPAERIIVG